MRDYHQGEVRRGPYINIQTGKPVRVYKLETGLYYADPFATFREGDLPAPLTGRISQNLIRLAEASKIQKLLCDTQYADDPRSLEVDSLPREDAPFVVRAPSQPKCITQSLEQTAVELTGKSPIMLTDEDLRMAEEFRKQGKGKVIRLPFPGSM